MTYEDVTEPRYILLSDKNEAIILDKPNWDGDWFERYFPGCSTADAYRISGEFVFSPESRIYVNWEIASAAGASYFLFAHKGITKNQIKLAKRYIRNSWDAVTITVVKYTEKIGGKRLMTSTMSNVEWQKLYTKTKEEVSKWRDTALALSGEGGKLLSIIDAIASQDTPVCPECRMILKKSFIECEDGSGWYCGWLCNCKPNKENIL